MSARLIFTSSVIVCVITVFSSFESAGHVRVVAERSFQDTTTFPLSAPFGSDTVTTKQDYQQVVYSDLFGGGLNK